MGVFLRFCLIFVILFRLYLYKCNYVVIFIEVCIYNLYIFWILFGVIIKEFIKKNYGIFRFSFKM